MFEPVDKDADIEVFTYMPNSVLTVDGPRQRTPEEDYWERRLKPVDFEPMRTHSDEGWG